MQRINYDEVRSSFSRFIEQASLGEEIIIIRDGKPVARLGPIAATESKPRTLGLGKGKFTFPDDFDKFKTNEIREMFENET
ncbi:type II toxin-antitoxin system Phd/YefM family antitoxin [Desulfovermiculus halophilus]|jgi:antitoxin (DNA-binding transcriptional repressor) of toxin-antitoxin stability system|uniref:type II toxin-antitoxin system Phd/YefM family antitoxin n=1 Tax=Desulfovermiculus halophilus TaxID=339722 RepID=UPI000A024DA7|nr:type II toxin-antitoxin system Phd/YefM family antitoxin [Desulfovermiculus halophilus]